MEQDQSQVPHVGGKPLKSLKDVLKEEYINQGSPEEFEGQHAPDVGLKNLLDGEKAAYLFDADEISSINKDLNEIDAELAGNGIPTGEPYTKEYLKFLKDNQAKLEGAFKDGFDTEKLQESTVTFNMEYNGRVKISVVDDPNHISKEKISKEVFGISSKLANQKGLAKIWAINERFGIDPDEGMTEEEAFNKELNKEPDEFYKFLKKPTEGYKYSVPLDCQLCKGKKNIKILFFGVKCPKCAGTGVIKVDSKEYYKRARKSSVPEIRSRKLVFEETNETVRY